MERSCPESYVEHSNACYFFGSYSSHETAKKACEADGARLADVGPVNTKYIKEQVHFLGGNDHWVGSYIVRSRVTKKKKNNCPMLRGQSTRGGGAFAQVDCNSAYPYICQKYGDERNRDRNVAGQDGFAFDGELEVPVTKPTPMTTQAVVDDGSSNSNVIAAVICLIMLIVLAFFIRFFCNKRAARKQKKEKQLQEQQQQLQKTTSSAKSMEKIGTATNTLTTRTASAVTSSPSQ